MRAGHRKDVRRALNQGAGERLAADAADVDALRL
jgi:hypothetical protein